MKVRDRYIDLTTSRDGNPLTLKVISDDAFAVCELIEDLMREVRRLK